MNTRTSTSKNGQWKLTFSPVTGRFEVTDVGGDWYKYPDTEAGRDDLYRDYDEAPGISKLTQRLAYVHAEDLLIHPVTTEFSVALFPSIENPDTFYALGIDARSGPLHEDARMFDSHGLGLREAKELTEQVTDSGIFIEGRSKIEAIKALRGMSSKAAQFYVDSTDTDTRLTIEVWQWECPAITRFTLGAFASIELDEYPLTVTAAYDTTTGKALQAKLTRGDVEVFAPESESVVARIPRLEFVRGGGTSSLMLSKLKQIV